MRMMRQLEEELMTAWALKFKLDSKEIMVARGNEVENIADAEWPGKTSMKILGLHVSNDGSTAMSVEKTLATVLKLGWRTAAQASKATLAWPKRERLLKTLTEGVLNSRWHCWSPSLAFCSKLDRPQRKLWSMALGLRRAPEEAWVTWVRRRGRAAASHIATKWSDSQIARAMSWTQHVRRGHVECSTANRVFGIRGLDWLLKRRLSRQMTVTGGGRIGSRLPGHVRKRYEESVDWAITRFELK